MSYQTIPDWFVLNQAKNTILVFDKDMYDEYRIGMNAMKRLREAKGLSQDQLAEMVGTSQPQIGRLEKEPDEPHYRPMSVKWAQRLAPHLECKPVDLLPLSNGIEDFSQKPENINPSETEQTLQSRGKDGKKVEGKLLEDDDPVLTAIGRLTVELERVRAELRQVKAQRGEMGPRKAQRK